MEVQARVTCGDGKGDGGLCAVETESQSGEGMEMSRHRALTPPVGPWKGEKRGS